MVIYLIVVGAAAGLLATRLMKIEVNLITTIAIGMGGALIGGFLLQLILRISSFFGGFVGATLGAVLLIWLYKTYWVGKK